MTHPLSGDDHFLECLREFHGIEMTHDDLAVLHKDLHHRRQDSARSRFNVSQSTDAALITYEINSGKIGQLVLGTAMGFLSGGWAGAALALVGGLIGQKQQKPQANQRLSEQYGFDQGGQVAPSGGVLPRIYCNRSINPAGGVRVGGILIHSRVETRRGTNILYQLYVIAAGQSERLGYGQLGAISTELTLFNQQPRRNFNDREIRMITRLGTRDQSVIPEFPYYSQNITPPDYAVFGVDSRAKVGGSATSTNPNFNTVNAIVEGSTVTKTGGLLGNIDAWNAGVFGQEGLQADGTFSFTAPVGTAAAGLSTTDQDQNWTSIQFGFLFTNNQATVMESGTARTGAIPVTPGSSYAVQIDNGQIFYLVNGGVVYTSAIVPSFPLYPDIALFTQNVQITNIAVGDGGFAIEGSITGTLTPTPNQGSSATSDEILDLFTPAQDYVISISGETKRDPMFYVIDKDSRFNQRNRTITTSPPVSGYNGKTIYAAWFARYENTKRVDRCDFNLLFNLSARYQNSKNQNDKDNGKLVTHGTLFDVWIRPVSSPIGTEVRLIRCVVKNRTSNKTYRGFRIMNLKLGRYYYEIRPLTAIPDDQPNIPIYELTDNGYGITDETDTEQLPTIQTGVTLLGNTIAVQGELEQITDLGAIRKWIGYDKKVNVSSESGATGRINSINEIVHWSSIGKTIETYPGLALTGYRFRASERLQQAPALAALIPEGSVVPNWIGAGIASSLSTASLLNAPGHNFIADGVQNGYWIRNLDKGIDGQITAVTASTIATSTPMQWNGNTNDRFAIYFLGSTCYLPDAFADYVRNDFGGIPDLLDPDEYIDYPSIVRSRKFCVANQYFYDDLTDQRVPFSQWAEEQARFSYLYAVRIDGRFGLTPDTQTPIDAVFNASNSRNFKLDYPDWQANVTNTIVIRFVDGREIFDQTGARHREVTVTVQTTAAYDGLVSPVVEEINARSIKDDEQAINIACLRLKSLRQNLISLSFDTSYAAAYVQAGDIVSIQHAAIDVNEDYSGFVTAVENDRVLLDCQPVLLEGIVDNDEDNTFCDGVAIEAGNSSNHSVSIGDLLLNLDTGEYGLIQNVTDTKIVAPVKFKPGDEWLVRNLTMPVGYEANITYREDDRTESLPCFYELIDGEVWLRIPGSTCELMDSVNVSLPEQQWRIQSVSPNGKEQFGVSALSHDPDIYSRRGLVIQVDDRVVRVQ